ncbi:Protein lev-9 [Geodia barretti]|uniref:Protein lev-9 n=1 Tax=Geodia barretti TaxID=519541 RepID=A0AA35QWG5_GEOBA|nr:Protein lev-9 [Geodia barretti]
MHAKLVSIWLACRCVFVKVMAHGVDLTLHARLSQCPDLSSPMSGSLLISGTGAGVYQETATYACETGFNLVGMSERVCQSDGTWSGSDPTCQMVMCPTLNDPDNGNLNLSGNSLGDSVFVKVMAHGVDLTLHARWLCVPLSMILIMAISTSVETLLEIQQSTHVTLATI